MSLNCREIDAILAELPLVGARVQRVLQPSYESLVLGLYAQGRSLDLMLSIAPGACRVHALRHAPPKPEKPLRFMECLRSRIRGGRIEAVRQLGDERILRFELSVPRESEEDAETAEILRYRLYARLWSGAGNILLVEDSGIIVDAIARRPGKEELSGQPCALEEAFAAAKEGGAAAEAVAKSAAAQSEGGVSPPRIFTVRDFPALEDRPEGGSLNERVEAFYAERGGELSREKLREAARERYARRERVLGARIAELSRRLEDFRGAERYKELGDILMANLSAPRPSGKLLECEDFYRGGSVAIEIDPRKSPAENAAAYYERFRKAESGFAELEAELESTRASLAAAKAELEALEAEEDPFKLARALGKGGTASTNKERSFPGLSLERSGWTILVGRSAKENDELLRRHVRGSDTWLHARDYAGSYVFVRARPGKSIPLEILLDAGSLALYYSKGRAAGEGDLYYTLVKYLRRAKDGPKGLVIPTQEKNLHVRLEEARLRELRALIGED